MIVLCSFFVIYLGTTNKKQEIVVSGIIPHKSETEMYLDSDIIIKGTVKAIKESKWSNENFERGKHIPNILQTDIVVSAEEVLKGTVPSKNVVVRINKGEDKKTIVRSDGYPDFDIGEETVLFLSRDDGDLATEEDYYVLTGMKQGKYNLKGKNIYFNEENEINIKDISGKIKELEEKYPDYHKIKDEKKKEITERNKKLFGE